MITVEYLPSHLNVKADLASRYLEDNSEWKLSPQIFRLICTRWGCLEIDLFASRLSHQLPKYYAWRPNPGSQATDAFLQKWSNQFLYAFPPFSLITRVLRKIRQEKAHVILISPAWQTQSWYALLLEMSVKDPILLPQHKNLLMDPQNQIHPLVKEKTLRLVAWHLSGNPFLPKDYQRGLQTLSEIAEDKAHCLLTNRPGESGLAGVVNKRLILFDAL